MPIAATSAAPITRLANGTVAPGSCILRIPWCLAGCRRAFAPLVLIAGVIGCGGGGIGAPSSNTCWAVQLQYAGTRTGTAYFKLMSDDGSLTSAGSQPSIQTMMRVLNAGYYCSGKSVGVADLPVTATVWIDSSGTEAVACTNVLSPQCQPSSLDAQVQQRAVLLKYSLTVVHLTLIDPP